MSQNLIHTTVVSIGPNSLGQDSGCRTRVPGLPREAVLQLDAHGISLEHWSKLHGGAADTRNPMQKFSVFTPLGDDYWLLGRAQYIGEEGFTASVSRMSGFVLKRKDLERIEWVAHRLLPFLPHIDRHITGPFVIDFDKASQPLRQATIDGKEYAGSHATNDKIAAAMGGIKGSDFLPTEFVLAMRVDETFPEKRPHSWSTTRHFGIGSPLLKPTAWTVYHEAENGASPVRPASVIPFFSPPRDPP